MPELVTAVEAGKITVSAAAEISGKPELEQREVVASNSGGSTTPDGKAAIKRSGKPERSKTGKSKKHAGDANVPGDMLPAAEVEKLKTELAAANDRMRELEEEIESARGIASRAPAVDGSMKAPTTDEDIPACLDHRPLGTEDQLGLDAIMVAWTNSAAPDALLRASPVVQERFIATVRAEIASARSRAGQALQ